MKGFLKLVLVLVLLLLAGGAGFIMAKLGVGSRVETANLPEAERRFSERMQNVSMVGSFTIGPLPDEPEPGVPGAANADVPGPMPGALTCRLILAPFWARLL